MHYALCSSYFIGRNFFWTNQIARTDIYVQFPSHKETKNPATATLISFSPRNSYSSRSLTELAFKNSSGLSSEVACGNRNKRIESVL